MRLGLISKSINGADPKALESDRRRAILRAAVEVFSKKGYHGCRIADVAREAGVAYGLVYHYFKNKDELLGSVFESGWSGFVERLSEQLKAHGSLEDRVRGIVRVAFEAYRHDPRGVKVLILEVGRSPSGGAVNRGTAFADIIRLAGAMFEEAQARGEFPRAHNPTLAAISLFGAIEMGLTAFVLGLLDRKSDGELERARDQVATAFLHGILPPSAPTETSTWTPPKSATKSKATKAG